MRCPKEALPVVLTQPTNTPEEGRAPFLPVAGTDLQLVDTGTQVDGWIKPFHPGKAKSCAGFRRKEVRGIDFEPPSTSCINALHYRHGDDERFACHIDCNASARPQSPPVARPRVQGPLSPCQAKLSHVSGRDRSPIRARNLLSHQNEAESGFLCQSATPY